MTVALNAAVADNWLHHDSLRCLIAGLYASLQKFNRTWQGATSAWRTAHLRNGHRSGFMGSDSISFLLLQLAE
jgi:hypothetical protein